MFSKTMSSSQNKGLYDAIFKKLMVEERLRNSPSYESDMELTRYALNKYYNRLISKGWGFKKFNQMLDKITTYVDRCVDDLNFVNEDCTRLGALQ